MRIWLAALVFLALPGLAQAGEWQFENADIPIAYVDNGAAQFQFACRGGDLAMAFWVRAPHRQVADAHSMNLAITADPKAGSGIAAGAGTSFAQDMPLIHADGTSAVVRGPVASQWARIAQKARANIRVGYVRHDAKGRLEAFDANIFDAKGSSAAIGSVLARCG